MGEITEKETKSITDNDQESVKLEKTIKINCAIPCPYTGYFYDSVGRINTERIQSLVGDEMSAVVAWYKFRQSPGFKLTVREKVIHNELTNIFQTPADLFTTCLLTREVSDNGSTHSFSQTFVRYCSLMYQLLPMHIVNLSDPNNSYKKPEPMSDSFKELLDKENIDLKNTQGVKVMTEIHNALQKETVSLSQEARRTYEEMFQLEEEIRLLKEALNRRTERELAAAASATSTAVTENNNVVVNDAASKKILMKEEIQDVAEKVCRTRSQAKRVSYSQITQGQKKAL